MSEYDTQPGAADYRRPETGPDATDPATSTWATTTQQTPLAAGAPGSVPPYGRAAYDPSTSAYPQSDAPASYGAPYGSTGSYPTTSHPSTAQAGSYGTPRRSGAGRVLAAIAGAGAIALCAGLAGGTVGYRLTRSDTAGNSTATTPVGAPAPVIDRSSLASIAERVRPSVVDINTGEGEGSGVVFSSDGAILTNNHVVAGAAGSTFKVTFGNGKVAQASIVSTDPAGDLAVIKAQGVSGLTVATFGNSDGLRVGDTVLALGSPLGLQGSVTAGIVSALHRTIEGGNGRRSIGDAIQTDAAINPGNSGGALVNTAGEVVGINTSIATSGQGQGNIGLGFAISSNRAKATADGLLKGGKVSHPFLGVQVGDADGGGALVGDVTAGSPAEKAGIKKGDVITKAGSKTISNGTDLVLAVQSGRAGDQLDLTIGQDGSARQVSVTLGES